MGMSETRKVLSIFLSVLMAVAVAMTGVLLVMNLTLSNRSFLEENITTDVLAEECEAQLDAKYAVLEAETGIPVRVFEAVKTDYPVDETLTNAFRNAFGAEDSSYYSSNMVDYFKELCVEYLEQSQEEYTEEEVAIAADKAAVIFSETVGLHEVDYVNTKLIALRRSVSSTLGIAAAVLVLLTVLMLILYTDKNKAGSYFCYGVAGGSLGMLISGLGCLIVKVPAKLQLFPAIYASVVGEMVRKYFLLLTAVGAAVLLIVYAVLFYLNREEYNNRRRR